MTKPWTTIDSVDSPDGRLELRRRGDDWLLTIDGRVLMTSAARRSEEALGHCLRDRFDDGRAPQLLISGLGLGHTLRAALDVLPPSASVVVAELNPVVVAWCREFLSETNEAALADPRVTTRVGDVRHVISEVEDHYDAILLDLYLGPPPRIAKSDPFYGPSALERTHAALRAGGVFGVWAEDRSEAFERLLEGAGFAVDRRRAGRGGRRHCIHLATKRPG